MDKVQKHNSFNNVFYITAPNSDTACLVNYVNVLHHCIMCFQNFNFLS
jgi:hypothetical protein